MDFEPKHSIEVEFKDFLDICQEIVQLAVKRLLPNSISDLPKDEQQELVDVIDRQINFEFARKPELKGLPITVTGYGLIYIADENETIATEIVDERYIVTGLLDAPCAIPIPTLESIKLSNYDRTPVIDETLSVMLMLDCARYARNDGAEYQEDLSGYSVGISLSHSLTPVMDHGVVNIS